MWKKLIMVSISFCLILSLLPDKVVKAEEIVQPDPVITVTAVGDIMMGTDYPSPKLPRKDGKLLFEASKEILRKADIVFGNLESPLYEKGSPAKKVKDRESYVFRTPPGYVKNLVNAGFNVVSLANNHAGE
jgi:poly-gamma-glutamate capsule biosynthesis protein CapA/YwtB (metallophosphatase superfamily)